MAGRFWEKPILPIGIDFGTSGVKVLQLQPVDGGLEVVAAAQARYAGEVPEDATSRQAFFAQTLRTALERAPFQGKRCIPSPLMSDLLIRAVRLPPMDDVELTKAARWEASERFAVPVDDLQVDWIKAGDVVQAGDSRDEVILIAIKRDALRAYLDAVLECELVPVSVDAPFCASARLTTNKLRREADQGVVQMTIDLGYEGTTVCITRGHDIAFVKYLEIGGKQLIEAISRRLNISIDEAVQMREERRAEEPDGVEDPEGATEEEVGRSMGEDRVDRAVLDATRPLMHELGQEAALCLRYYSVTFRGARPSKIQLIGGEANEPMLDKILAEELKVETVVVNPLDGVAMGPGAARFDRRKMFLGQWAVSAGLSLRPIPTRRDEKKTVSIRTKAALSKQPSKTGRSRGAA